MLAPPMRVLLLVAAVIASHPAAGNAEELAGSGLPYGENWTGLLGTGLLTLGDASTLPHGKVTATLTVDNRDRDPLGMDVLDGSANVTVGLGSKTEVYGQFVVSRVVALPELPALPPPPLDVIVAPGTPTPARPFYSLYPPIPFVNDRHGGRFDDWVQGDAVIGAKHRFRGFEAGGPAIAGTFEFKFPVSRALRDLQSGSGTGSMDLAASALAEWRFEDHALVASVGYTLVGSPAEYDLIYEFDSAGTAVIQQLPIQLRDRVRLGAGFRYVLSERFALVGEATAAISVGGGSAILDRVNPIDLLAGVQTRLGSLRINAALLYYANSLPSGDERPSPYPGAVDLTAVADPELTRYLAAIGAGGAGIDPESERQRLVIGAPARVSPPAGARIIPASYGIRSEHQIGYIFVIGWAF